MCESFQKVQFEGIRDFYQRAAERGDAVLFTAEQ